MEIRFERSEAVLEKVEGDVADHVIFGPFEWVQMTYNMLRVAPEVLDATFYEREEAV